jgi:hypothetical protein
MPMENPWHKASGVTARFRIPATLVVSPHQQLFRWLSDLGIVYLCNSPVHSAPPSSALLRWSKADSERNFRRNWSAIAPCARPGNRSNVPRYRMPALNFWGKPAHA